MGSSTRKKGETNMSAVQMSVATEAVWKAGELIKDAFKKDRTVAIKSDGDLVSSVDLACDRLFRDILLQEFPDDGACSEEAEERHGSSGYRWIFDPLDGTHNFLAGIDICGSLLALEHNGAVIWGAASFPLRNEFFVAARGRGTFCNGQRLSVRKSETLRGEIFFSAGSVRKSPLIMRDIDRFAAAGCRLRVFGSSPFSFTRLAMGQGAVATMRGSTPWDLAAVMLFVQEAGGIVSDEDGNTEFSVDAVKDVIASNGFVHNDALALFRN